MKLLIMLLYTICFKCWRISPACRRNFGFVPCAVEISPYFVPTIDICSIPRNIVENHHISQHFSSSKNNNTTQIYCIQNMSSAWFFVSQPRVAAAKKTQVCFKQSILKYIEGPCYEDLCRSRRALGSSEVRQILHQMRREKREWEQIQEPKYNFPDFY